MLLSPKPIVVTSLLLSAIYATAQTTPDIVREQWSAQPVIHKVDARYDKESAVTLFDKRRIEYVDIKEELAAYKTLHKLIHVNDDRGIEGFNKVYLPVNDNADIVDIRARTILPNGKIIEVDKKNIKDLKEKDRQYKIFAMEGLEKGCEVEFYYTYRTDAAYFGREILQGEVPVLDVQVEVLSPARLVFETKGYNDVQKATDSLVGAKRISSLHLQDIPGVDEEKYAWYAANLKRLEYRLSYNASRSKTERLFTWNDLAKRAYGIYATYSEKELKKTEGLISDAGWKNNGDETATVVAVENYLKKNIATREDIQGEDAENLEKVIKNKIASHRGMLRLYGAIFSKLGITHEFVLCGSRNEYAIDKTFENWNNCDNQLIYFPKLKKFLAPTSIEWRFPWINPVWAGSNGLFCKGTTIGNFTTAIAEIRPVVLEDYTQSSNNIEASVRLNATADTLVISAKQLYRGYSSMYYKASFTFNSEEDQKLMIKELVKFGTQSENIVNSKVENKDFDSYHTNKPFILDATVNASELVEKAGNKVLVKIGEIIGTQVELYQDKPRRFQMDLQYPHILDRTIDFTIPDGYQVKNLNDLNISKVYVENNEPSMGFESTYKQEGNMVKIHILEQYRRINYPLSLYDQFKAVINAAADFNKVTLVLEKK
jgi:hypothetical protein